VGPGVRSPGTLGAGSHTKFTRVSPASSREMPNHGRISGLEWRTNFDAKGSTDDARIEARRSSSSFDGAQ
jgi:hypothetical protein